MKRTNLIFIAMKQTPAVLNSTPTFGPAAEAAGFNEELGNDVAKIAEWLSNYRQSPDTYSSYHREAYRFLMWIWEEHKATLRTVDLVLFNRYLEFLASPDKGDKWQSDRRATRDEKEWRPFWGKPGETSSSRTVSTQKHSRGFTPVKGGLSSRSVDHARAVLKGMLRFMAHTRYIDRNPAEYSRKAKSLATTTASDFSSSRDRFIPEEGLMFIMDQLEAIEPKTVMEAQKKNRDIWIIQLLFGTMMRRSEVSLAKVGDIRDRYIGGKSSLWIQINGKGGRIEAVPFNSQLQTAFGRYLSALGIAQYPQAPSHYPLVLPVLRNKVKHTSELGPHYERAYANAVREHTDNASGTPPFHLTANMIWRIISEIMIFATQKAMESNDNDLIRLAARLKSASTHWMRHSGAQKLVESGRNLKKVQKMLRHKDVSTTMIYVSASDSELAEISEEDLSLKVATPKEAE